MEKSHVGMTRCFYCGEHDKILLDRTLKDSLPKECGIIDMEPCSKCEDHMKDGIILLGMKAAPGGIPIVEHKNRNGEVVMQIPNPVRTGHFMVVKEEFARRTFGDDPTVVEAIGRRWLFVTDEVAEQINSQYIEEHGGKNGEDSK